MISKIKEFIALFSHVIGVCIALFGWLLTSLSENYYLSTLYPYYIAILIAGIGMIKYQEREIHQTPHYALELEAKYFPKIMIVLLSLIFILFLTKLVTWEILIIPSLMVFIFYIRLRLVKRTLGDKKNS